MDERGEGGARGRGDLGLLVLTSSITYAFFQSGRFYSPALLRFTFPS